MEKRSAFVARLAEEGYHEAELLLVDELRSAAFVDPHNDYTWGVAADELGYRVLADRGPEAFASFNERLLRLFVGELEPTWGHIHKGHIYFRLGFGVLAADYQEGLRYLRLALDEDRLVAQEMAHEREAVDGASVIEGFPSYVTLAVLERIDASHLPSDPGWQAFLAGLAPLRFDVVWDHKEVDPGLVLRALRRVSPPGAVDGLWGLHRDLGTSLALGMTHAVLPTLVALIEDLLAATIEADGVTPTAGDRSSGSSLGRLMERADVGSMLPGPSIRTAFLMADVLRQQMRRPDPDSVTFPTTPALRRNVNFAMKALIDRVLLEWAGMVP